MEIILELYWGSVLLAAITTGLGSICEMHRADYKQSQEERPSHFKSIVNLDLDTLRQKVPMHLYRVCAHDMVFGEPHAIDSPKWKR